MIDFSLQRENIQTDAFISLPYKNISQGIEKLKQTMSSRKWFMSFLMINL